MESDRFPHLRLGLFDGGCGGKATGQIGGIRRVIALGLLDDDRVAHMTSLLQARLSDLRGCYGPTVAGRDPVVLRKKPFSVSSRFGRSLPPNFPPPRPSPAARESGVPISQPPPLPLPGRAVCS